MDKWDVGSMHNEQLDSYMFIVHVHIWSHMWTFCQSHLDPATSGVLQSSGNVFRLVKKPVGTAEASDYEQEGFLA